MFKINDFGDDRDDYFYDDYFSNDCLIVIKEENIRIATLNQHTRRITKGKNILIKKRIIKYDDVAIFASLHEQLCRHYAMLFKNGYFEIRNKYNDEIIEYCQENNVSCPKSIVIKNCKDFAFNHYNAQTSCYMKELITVGLYYTCGNFCYIKNCCLQIYRENDNDDDNDDDNDNHTIIIAEKKIKADYILYYD